MRALKCIGQIDEIALYQRRRAGEGLAAPRWSTSELELEIIKIITQAKKVLELIQQRIYIRTARP